MLTALWSLNGEIMEKGSHTELLEEKGRYYQLYTGQFELDRFSRSVPLTTRRREENAPTERKETGCPGKPGALFLRSKDSGCCATEGKVDRGNLPEGMTQFHTDRVAQQLRRGTGRTWCCWIK